MQLYCCIWLVGLLRIYLSCVFPRSRGQELPAEVAHAQPGSDTGPHFISRQAVETLISIKNNSLQKQQAVIEIRYCGHSFQGRTDISENHSPVFKPRHLPAACSHPWEGSLPGRCVLSARTLLPLGGCGILLQLCCTVPFNELKPVCSA